MPKSLVFLGGVAGEYVTEEFILGFRDAFEARGISPAANAVDCCGYNASAARQALAHGYESLGRLPAGLFINSITAFEGLVQFTSQLSWDALQSTVVGCFDWDPFAAHLPFEVTMMRQDVDKIISEAFALAYNHEVAGTHPLVVVPTGFGNVMDEDDQAIKHKHE